jgi:predicted aspartyl protease
LADFRAFTYRIPQNHQHAIVIGIKVGIPLPVENAPAGKKLLIDAKALVDTGASGSCISQRFAESAKLISFTMTESFTAQGSHFVPVYRIDLLLPNNVMFINLPSVGFAGRRDFDFILGMDILSKGDIAITNANNEMMFSFRIPPSESHTDYTKQNDVT